MKSVNPNATREIPVECDKDLPAHEQTVFEAVQLSAEEQAYLQNLTGLPGTMTLDALHLGLSGSARNFIDPTTGEAVVFRRDDNGRAIVGKKKPWAGNILTFIPPRERDILATKIFKGVGMEDAAVKNS